MTVGTAFTETGPCWICGGSDLARVHEAIFELGDYREQDPQLAAYTGEQVWIRRCSGCAFGQPEQLPSLNGYFDRLYDQRWSAAWIAAEFDSRCKDLIFARVLDELERRLPASRRRLLDIGAHVGRFIYLAQQRGWLAEGVELNPRTAAYAAERTGVRIHRVNAHEFGTLGGRFDAVTLTDVLEHIPRPVELLASVRAVMAPDACIAVKVPCGPAQLFKEKVRALLLRHYRATIAGNLVHVNHFSPRSLALALTRAAFDMPSVEIAAPELPEGNGWRGRASTRMRLAIFHAGRVMPGGISSPLALNLQAYARAPR